MNFMRKKIAAKLSLQTGLLVLAMVIAIGFLSYFQASKAITAEVESKLTTKLELLVSNLQGKMDLISSKLDMIGKLEMVKDFAVRPDSKAPISSILKTVLEDNKVYLETLFIADGKGNIIMDGSDGAYLNVNVGDRDYFKQAMSGQAVWSEVLTSKKSGEQVRVYAYPIKDKNDATIGILSAAVKIAPIAQAVLDTKEGQQGYAYLIDKSGTILVHPKADFVGKNIDDFNIPELSAAKADMTSGKSGKVIYTYKGIKKLNAYVPFDTFSVSLNAASSEYLAPVNKMGVDIAIYGLVFLILGVGLSTLISLMIAKKIKATERIVRYAAAGDLTHRINSKTLADGDELDQMGYSVNTMMDKFNDVISEIHKASELMSSTSQQMAASAAEGGKAAGEVTAAIQEISAGLTEQAEFALRTDKEVNDMSALIDLTVEETSLMAEETYKVMTTAENSQNHMKNTMKQMDDIQASSMTTFAIVQTLSSQSEEIGQISSAISSIADQTNLLALNAAIEAARAGEQGRGFAVVAEEIRKLASESMLSAENIGKLIDQIQSEIKRAETAIQDESQSISRGVSVIGQTQSAFVQIMEAIESTMHIIDKVIGVTAKTKHSTGEVARAVTQIAEVTQNASASAEEVNASTEEQNAISEEIAGAAEHISQLAIALLDKVSVFKVSR